ncbi:hypothetical protein ACIQRW_34515 [Streptomyces sp. NPDC091287]|uniref:hypothetical protein n=1 Tax=Streptomyces sp. NPDC091287 TaxID=3365988 RepID=UPI00382445E4
MTARHRARLTRRYRLPRRVPEVRAGGGQTARAGRLAGQAATAAREAHRAANSSADHAEAAAKAANEAADHAGEADAEAKKATAHAKAAREAATVATDATLQADNVEKVAREAEKVRLEQEESDTTEDAKLLKTLQDESEAVDKHARTQAAQMDAETKQLLADAAAKAGSDEPAAAALARRAAVNLLGSTGVWTRQSAGQALSGTDADMLIWLESGRLTAQEADDRETLLHFAQIGTAKTAVAAEAVLAQGPEEIEEYLTTGILETQRDEFRVQTLRAMEGAGKGVTAAGTAALNDGSTEALSTFLVSGYPKALADDEQIETLRILEEGGPYVQAAARNSMARNSMAGPA